MKTNWRKNASKIKPNLVSIILIQTLNYQNNEEEKSLDLEDDHRDLQLELNRLSSLKSQESNKKDFDSNGSVDSLNLSWSDEDTDERKSEFKKFPSWISYHKHSIAEKSKFT